MLNRNPKNLSNENAQTKFPPNRMQLGVSEDEKKHGAAPLRTKRGRGKIEQSLTKTNGVYWGKWNQLRHSQLSSEIDALTELDAGTSCSIQWEQSKTDSGSFLWQSASKIIHRERVQVEIYRRKLQHLRGETSKSDVIALLEHVLTDLEGHCANVLTEYLCRMGLRSKASAMVYAISLYGIERLDEHFPGVLRVGCAEELRNFLAAIRVNVREPLNSLLKELAVIANPSFAREFIRARLTRWERVAGPLFLAYKAGKIDKKQVAAALDKAGFRMDWILSDKELALVGRREIELRKSERISIQIDSFRRLVRFDSEKGELWRLLSKRLSAAGVCATKIGLCE